MIPSTSSQHLLGLTGEKTVSPSSEMSLELAVEILNRVGHNGDHTWENLGYRVEGSDREHGLTPFEAVATAQRYLTLKSARRTCANPHQVATWPDISTYSLSDRA